jgi:hypothetical protein
MLTEGNLSSPKARLSQWHSGVPIPAVTLRFSVPQPG